MLHIRYYAFYHLRLWHRSIDGRRALGPPSALGLVTLFTFNFSLSPLGTIGSVAVLDVLLLSGYQHPRPSRSILERWVDGDTKLLGSSKREINVPEDFSGE
jgi:hypothetical protein